MVGLSDGTTHPAAGTVDCSGARVPQAGVHGHAAPVVGFLPMILWLLGSALKGGLQDETTTIGTLPWLMILTMPAGFVVFIVGTVLALNPHKRG